MVQIRIDRWRENELGIPYWIWVVLPRVFPDLTPGPGGYKAFGVIWEFGKEAPVGFSKKTIGFPRVGNNCALCHVSEYRTIEDENPRLILGAPANALQVQEIFRFFSAAANDSRFNADKILEQIEREVELSWLDKLLYRFLIIPRTRDAFAEQGASWPGWIGRGRRRGDPVETTPLISRNTSSPNFGG